MPKGRRFSSWVVASAVCAVAVALAQAVSLAIVFATILYSSYCMLQGFNQVSLVDVLKLLPFVGTIVVGQGLRQNLRHQRDEPWVHGCFVAFTLGAMIVSFGWFKDPMHDIALFFGSHGRWGCGTVNADGSESFTVRDDTAPLILFTPVLLATAAHWLASRWHHRRLRTSALAEE
jgi:hypothetical protein